MCLIAFAWRHHPRFPLVVAANRDEFHQRPTASASFWPDRPHILAGRDLLGRGTWLGVSSRGRFAALTNLRPAGAARRDAPSRGSLVSAFLDATVSPGDYLAEVADRAHEYNGFCLVAGDGAEMGYYCARDAAPSVLAPGIHGLSNARLHAPWPKVERLKSGLAEVLFRAQWGSGDLLDLLGDRTPAADGELPNTGVGLVQERIFSSAFVAGAHYGTRSSTVLRVDAAGRVDFTEQSFDSRARAAGRAHFSFLIDSFAPTRAAR